MILAFDIGGTKIAMASFTVGAGGGLTMGPVSRFETDHYASDAGFAGLIEQHFGGAAPKISGIGIGVAGPVLGRRVQLTNVAWAIDADHLAGVLGAPVFLLNDLVAHGHAVPQLDLKSPASVITLQAGTVDPNAKIWDNGPAVLIAAGTGLGEAVLAWHHGKNLVLPSEGGHSTFAPVEARDAALGDFLRRRYEDGHVSWERVVSGLDGFRNLYDFLIESGEIRIPPSVADRLTGEHDIGAQIITAAAAGQSYAVKIVAWFARLYGAEAGNLALKVLATGGVYLAGGIAPHILPWLREGEFIRGFTSKGRFSDWLKTVPVRLITEPNAALIGAAHYTAAHL